jgi:hypothetical protein
MPESSNIVTTVQVCAAALHGCLAAQTRSALRTVEVRHDLACVESQQDSYKALKRALSEHERSVCQRQRRQALSRRSAEKVKGDNRAHWKAKAAAREADFAAYGMQFGKNSKGAKQVTCITAAVCTVS